ncbi:prepilin-type N-terminal cleavage/methylation domain-containing protein [Lentzea nigeriaca]
MAARDGGETLIELVVAVSIMGVALVAVMAGLGTSVLVSDVHRKQATAGSVLHNYVEAINAAVTGGGYVNCAPSSAYASPAGFTPPSGYSASVVSGSMRYWNGSAWQSACPATDTGLQQLTARVASADARAAETVVLTLRKPCRPVDPPCG